MQTRQAIELLAQHPVIAAIRDRKALPRAAAASTPCVFLLAADLMTLDQDMALLAAAGKSVFIHMDLITGLGHDSAGIRFLSSHWHPTGIISTHQHLLRAGQEEGLLTIQRVFVMDNYAITTGLRLVKAARADFIELLPGVIPKAIRTVHDEIQRPIIAGGMIAETAEITQALQAGALAVSTGAESLWNHVNG